jgi:hypothetical protein
VRLQPPAWGEVLAAAATGRGPAPTQAWPVLALAGLLAACLALRLLGRGRRV